MEYKNKQAKQSAYSEILQKSTNITGFGLKEIQSKIKNISRGNKLYCFIYFFLFFCRLFIFTIIFYMTVYNVYTTTLVQSTKTTTNVLNRKHISVTKAFSSFIVNHSLLDILNY